MIQTLEFSNVAMRREHAEDHPYFIAGNRMYAIGMMSGAQPHVGEEHLVGDMGGLWSQPIKVLDAWGIKIEMRESSFAPSATKFISNFWRVERIRESNDVRVSELECIDEDDAVMLIQATVVNTSNTNRTMRAAYEVQPHVRACWMSPLVDGDDHIERFECEVLAFDKSYQNWAVAVIAEPCLEQTITLAPGESYSMRIVVAATHDRSVNWARAQALKAMKEFDARLEKKRLAYESVASPLNAHSPLPVAITCALLNLKLLETHNLAGRYAMAGLPEYPNLFGCDTTYSVAGMCAAGRSDLAMSALRSLREIAMKQCGRVPHEVIPDGNIFHPGNTQETPQFVIAVHSVWSRLANDERRTMNEAANEKRQASVRPSAIVGRHSSSSWLTEMYPVCRAGLLNYLRGAFVMNASRFPYYPHGNAMVEREGMLPLKLDSVCYTWRALRCFVEMSQAAAQNERIENTVFANDIAQAEIWAKQIEENFEKDWWIEREGFYADSLGWDGKQQLDKHWTQVVPLEVGLAQKDRATNVLNRIEREWLNEDGLPHTVKTETRVWTLPTGLLALVAARAGRRDLAIRLLNDIAKTLQSGQLGLYEELIPKGLCFIQLWSAALVAEIVDALHDAEGKI